MTGKKPMLLRPASKDYLWGGSRLNDDFNLGIDMYPLAEAWVCSTHPDGPSTVEGADETKVLAEGSGEDKTLANDKTLPDARREDKSLADVLREDPSMLGSHVLQITEGKAELPILIKLIDAKSDLSVQVHPDDEYAKRVEGQWGKTEMWYVLSAKPGAQLVYGFNRDLEAEQVRKALAEKRLNECLNHVPVKKNDLFFIQAGTVHAIGAGCLIAEIQQSSNVTYRLYDYDRVGKDGKLRPLHVDKALEVANLKSSVSPRQPMRVLKYVNGCAAELLSRCKYFQVERMLLNTEGRKLVDFRTGSNSFHALLCVDGCGVLFGEGYMQNFFKGDCIFVPANSMELKLHGTAQILDVSC